MASIDEQLSARFRQWECRTRGTLVYPHPVPPEPPFAPFPGHYLTDARSADDGRRPTVLSSLWQGLWSRPVTPEPAENEDEPEANRLERGDLIELPLYLPESFNVRGPEFEGFVSSLFVCQQPLAFELVGTATQVTAQLAVSPEDGGHVRQQLRAFFPDLVSTPTTGTLQAAWQDAGQVAAVVEFGLGKESMLPLGSASHDPYLALVGVLSELSKHECGLFQVLWQSLESKWAENLVRSATDPTGKAFFVNAPELAGAVKNKTARPLYAAVVRIAACSSDFDRSWEILRLLAGGLRPFAHPNGNELIPLRNDEYPFDEHIEDVVRRQSRRAGMVLNADELLGLVHLPSSAVRSAKFRRQIQKTKPSPAIASNEKGLLLGSNEHAGEERLVRLTREQRRRHMHIIGASGTGKTTLLFNLIQQDIEAGEGLAVLDPHGDLIDRILGIIPPSRINDVVLLDPGDEEYSIGFNILSAHSDLEKNLLASDLVSVFQRLSTSWGDQMGVVLNNAIRAFLESEQGGTLADLRRFLIEPAYRGKFLATVRDLDIVYYWQKSFAQLSGNKSLGPVLTRLETFLSPKPIRYMVSQQANRLDFADIMDGGKIFLAKLSQGAIGKENSYLLGSLLLAKFQQIAMGRQRQEEAARRDCWLYLDEFHNFITPSTAEILTGARKYHLGLTLAHQELRQLQRDGEVASAVLANPYTRVCFRVGDQDARTLEHGFSTFAAKDLQNLGTGEAVCRIERSDYDFNLAVQLPEYPDETEAALRRQEVITASRDKYATSRAMVEAALLARAEVDSSGPTEVRQKTKPKVAPLPAAALPSSLPVPDAPAIVAPIRQPAAKPVALVSQPVPVAETESKPAPLPADLGRGGVQHKAIQFRIKEAAEALGFRVFVEKSILEGRGQVDLVLEREGLAIACEVTVTTTIDQELGNVSKCIKAGFAQIAVISGNADKLAKIAQAVRTSLGEEAASKVSYQSPDEFITLLPSLRPAAQEPIPVPATKRVRGWKVRTSYGTLPPEEIKAREQQQIQLMAEIMSRKPK